MHDPPDGSEQPDERSHRADRREDVEPVGEPVDLGSHGGVQRDRQPRPRPLTVDILPRGRAAPLGDSGGEHPRRRSLVAAARLVEPVDVVGLPEVALEALALAPEPPHPERVRDDDRPGPEAGEQQADHHRHHHRVGLEEQVPQRQVVARARVRIGYAHSFPSTVSRRKISAHSRG